MVNNFNTAAKAESVRKVSVLFALMASLFMVISTHAFKSKISSVEHSYYFERVMERLLNDLQLHHRMNLPLGVSRKITSPV